MRLNISSVIYDYYQPEAYIAHTDTFIEKDSSINDEIDKFVTLPHLPYSNEMTC